MGLGCISIVFSFMVTPAPTMARPPDSSALDVHNKMLGLFCDCPPIRHYLARPTQPPQPLTVGVGLRKRTTADFFLSFADTVFIL
jgi:hypothetical protein